MHGPALRAYLAGVEAEHRDRYQVDPAPDPEAAARVDLWPGKRVVWRHTPRGGYGFTLRIPVAIVSIADRVRVLVEATGDEVDVRRDLLVDADMRIEDGSTAEPPAAHGKRSAKDAP